MRIGFLALRAVVCAVTLGGMSAGCHRPAAPAPPTAVATSPATARAATAHAGKLVVVWVADTDRGAKVKVVEEPGRTVIDVIDPTGIGSAVLRLDGARWPDRIVVRLRYAEGRPFERLEGGVTLNMRPPGRKFDAQNAEGELRVELPKGNVSEVTLPRIPAGTERLEMHVHWLDAFR